MKRSIKALIATIFASMSIGTAIGVGGFSNAKDDAKVTEAATATTLYCKMEYSWWTTSGAAIGAYAYNSASDYNAAWPGVRMTKTSVDNEWKIDLAKTYKYVIFTRVNGSGTIADWGAKTKDQTLLADGTNYCTITNSSAVWGDPGCDTSWSVKKDKTPSSSKNQFYVYDPHTVLGTTLANINVYGYDDNQKNLIISEWPGTNTGITSTTVGITPMYSVSISQSYVSFIMNNTSHQTVDLTISGNTGKVLVIENNVDGIGHYYTHWDEVSKYNGSGNYPTGGEGYYIVKSGNSYSFTNSTKMSSADNPYVAKVTSFSATNGQGIKVRGFYNDRDDPNIWSFYAGETTYGSADGDGNFIFNQTCTVDICAKYVNDELKFYVLEHVDNPGYYILGNSAFAADHGSSAPEWTFASGLKMNTLSGEGNRASYVLTVSRTVQIRLRECLSLDHGWITFGATYDGTDGITTMGDNVQLLAGTYTLYVNSGGASYVLKGIPLDAFCTDFLDTIKDVCKMDGSTTIGDLTTAWSTLSNLYNDVLASEKPTIVAIGFNGGSDVDDPHKVVKAYHYIVTKYGTSKCADFIWGQNYAGSSSAVRITVFGNQENNNTIIIVSVISVITVGAVAGYFFLRRRKED